jgi:hypothetical protein
MIYHVILVHHCMFWYILVYNKRVDSRISAWCCPHRARKVDQDILYTSIYVYKQVHLKIYKYIHITQYILVYTTIQRFILLYSCIMIFKFKRVYIGN